MYKLKASGATFVLSSVHFFILWKYLANICTHKNSQIQLNSASLQVCVSSTVLGFRVAMNPLLSCLPGLCLNLPSHPSAACCVCPEADLREDVYMPGLSPRLLLFCPRWSPVFPAYCTWPHPQSIVSGAAGPGSPWCLGYYMFSQQQGSATESQEKITSFTSIRMKEQPDFWKQ